MNTKILHSGTKSSGWLRYCTTLHGSMLYDVSGGHVTSHIVVLDVEHPRRMSESTSYLTQLSKAKADTFHKKA